MQRSGHPVSRTNTQGCPARVPSPWIEKKVSLTVSMTGAAVQDASCTLVIYHPRVRTNDLRRGAMLMIGAALMFALMGAAVKVAARTLSNAEVVFFRCALGLLALAPWIVPRGLAGLRTSRPGEHLIRGVAGLGTMACFFYAIAHMRLPDAVLLNYSLPLFMPFVEALWLGEPIPRRLWWPVTVGFAGIVLILKPGIGVFQPVALVGVLAALFASVAQVGVRQLTRTEPLVRDHLLLRPGLDPALGGARRLVVAHAAGTRNGGSCSPSARSAAWASSCSPRRTPTRRRRGWARSSTRRWFLRGCWNGRCGSPSPTRSPSRA